MTWSMVKRGRWMKHRNGGLCRVLAIKGDLISVEWPNKRVSNIHRDNLNNYTTSS